MKLKICGMRDVENITKVAGLSPDYMGFIFYPNSPRYVGEEFTFSEHFPPSVQKVGVFVNERVRNIKSKALKLGFRFLQLHGQETVDQCNELREEGFKVIKVFSVDDDFDFNMIKDYKKSADYFLFDTKGKYYGGNAKTFNWKILQRYDQDVPFFLSGGLSPDNIEMVKELEGMNIHALDMNSGIEISPGIKSIEKIKEVISLLAGRE